MDEGQIFCWQIQRILIRRFFAKLCVRTASLRRLSSMLNPPGSERDPQHQNRYIF